MEGGTPSSLTGLEDGMSRGWDFQTFHVSHSLVRHCPYSESPTATCLYLHHGGSAYFIY